VPPHAAAPSVVLVGGTLGGILGALLALPIAAGLQIVLRELRFDLPGETPPSARAPEPGLAEDLPAADAIADDLASIVKQTEEGCATLSAQLPTVKPT
jgi:hypothetical protein